MSFKRIVQVLRCRGEREEGFEYPLRSPKDCRNFYLALVVVPAGLTAVLAFFSAELIFDNTSSVFLLAVSAAHFFALLVFLVLFWLPVALAIFNFSDRAETRAVGLRTAALLAAIGVLFPHQLVREALQGEQQHALIPVLYWGFGLVLGVGYAGLSWYNNSRKAFGEVRKAAAPQSRTRSDRWVWFEALSIFMVLFAVIVLEGWFLALMSAGRMTAEPYRHFTWTARNKAVQAVKDSVLKSHAEQGKKFVQEAQLEEERRQHKHAVFPPDSTLAQARSDTLRQKAAAAPVLYDTIGLVPDSAAFQQTLTTSDSSQRKLAATAATAPQFSQSAIAAAEAEARRMEQKLRMIELTWMCCSILCGLIFFLTACLPNRLMQAVLIPVTFHERDVRGVFFKAHRYLLHFARALLLKNPLLVLGGAIMTAVFFVTPAILTGAGQLRFLDNLAQVDEAILVLGVFLAWFIPLALQAVTPDDTFGEYFTRRLANHLMMIQGHLVFIGHGDLGKRVLAREIDRLHKLQQQTKRVFVEVVTPDLRLEQLCTQAVVIEHTLKDVVYSSGTQLLGEYGAVSTCRQSYKSRDMHGNTIHPEKRILVPIVRGEAREPFISSRVNLERASLVISMVPDEDSVQAVFERALKSNVKAVICVTRSDLISYLTYRSRHRSIILVYPKHNQGITLGERLWAAILKVRAVRNMEGNHWPRVLIVGNHKANHYLLEKLWSNLPGNHQNKNHLLEQNFSFIVTTSEGSQEHPMLKGNERPEAFDQNWPATYVTGGRYPYPSLEVAERLPSRVAVRMVNASDVRALEACLEESRSEILVLNHEDSEKSLLMLSRCMRALERIKTRKPSRFRLPMLLLSAARGDEWERLSLGDASHFYDALCNLYCEDLAADLSYPEHAHYDHVQREQIGESVVDSQADVEEMIAAARLTLHDPLPLPSAAPSETPGDRPARPEFIEVNGCLPNRPGALADYVAQLAGISYQAKSAEQIATWWRVPGETSAPLLPSYQYLRYLTLDPQSLGFALSGYATLEPMPKDLPANEAARPWVKRIFASDGRHYVETERDKDAVQFTLDKELLEKVRESIKPPQPPGVPQVLDRLTGRAPGGHNTIADFRNVMLDPQGRSHFTGKHACPGMPICRIAAFQDYVATSNSLRLQRHSADPGNAAYAGEKLLHARNYHCCSGAQPSPASEPPHPDLAYARFVCCCHGPDEPGLIAVTLNTLLFRFHFQRRQASNNPEEDWVINIKYFKDITCQNPHYSLNRLFGVFALTSKVAQCGLELPLQMIRILPIGKMASARQWYAYARCLHAFLEAGAGPGKYRFYWMDEKRVQHEDEKAPAFDEKHRRDYPVVLAIEKAELRQEREKASSEFCDICGRQKKEYDCRKMRAWV